MVSIKSIVPPEQPTFTRDSTAYLDGVEHAVDEPRFPNGDSILIEEGTTNLLPAAQADTLSSAYTTGSLTGDHAVSVEVGTIDVSGGLTGTATPGNPVVGDPGGSTVTLTPSGGDALRSQVEEKPYATSWHPGGETRNNDLARISPNAASLAEGTIEVDLYITNRMLENDSGSIHIVDFRGISSVDAIVLFFTDNDLRVLTRRSSDSNSTKVLISKFFVAQGWNRLSATWNEVTNELRLKINNQTISTGSYTKPSADIAISSLGSSTDVSTSSSRVNTSITSLRVSNRARTDTELSRWEEPLTADEDTTYLMNFEGDLTAEEGGLTLPHTISQNQSVIGSGAFIQFAGRTVPVAARSEAIHNEWEFEALFARDEQGKAADLLELFKTTYNSPDGRLTLSTTGGLDSRINIQHPIEVHSWNVRREPGGILRMTFSAVEVDE